MRTDFPSGYGDRRGQATDRHALDVWENEGGSVGPTTKARGANYNLSSAHESLTQTAEPSLAPQITQRVGEWIGRHNETHGGLRASCAAYRGLYSSLTRQAGTAEVMVDAAGCVAEPTVPSKNGKAVCR
jgi:hypothetical protein